MPPYEEYQKKAKVARSEHKVNVFGIIHEEARALAQLQKEIEAEKTEIKKAPLGTFEFGKQPGVPPLGADRG